MKHLSLVNILMALMGLVAIASVALVIRIYAPPVSGPDKGDEYPFQLTSEFPVSGAPDMAVLDATASSLISEGGRWRLTEVRVLTDKGKRVGVQGNILLDSPTDSQADITPRVCGDALQGGGWNAEFPDSPGFYIALLDGQTAPFYLIPLTEDGVIPRAKDLGLAREYSCQRNRYS